MTDDFNPDLDLMIERKLSAPRNNVWKAWTTPELMERWWAPRPWQTRIHALDVRPGGAFGSEMIGPDGESFRSEGCFLLVEDHHRIVFTDALARGYRPNPTTFMTASFTMTDTPDGGCLYIARVKHASAETRKQHEDMGFEGGWNTCITQLEELASGLETAS